MKQTPLLSTFQYKNREETPNNNQPNIREQPYRLDLFNTPTSFNSDICYPKSRWIPELSTTHHKKLFPFDRESSRFIGRIDYWLLVTFSCLEGWRQVHQPSTREATVSLGDLQCVILHSTCSDVERLSRHTGDPDVALFPHQKGTCDVIMVLSLNSFIPTTVLLMIQDSTQGYVCPPETPSILLHIEHSAVALQDVVANHCHRI